MMRYLWAVMMVYSTLMLLGTTAPLRGQEQSPGAALVVHETDGQISVRSNFGSGWKAVVNRQRGGVVTGLHFPPDGPNILSDSGGRFGGMFEGVYVDFRERGKAEGYVAKGALYGFGRVERMQVLERSASKVVIEVLGKGGNQVKEKPGDVIAYRQRYTFQPNRIECDGEVNWLFDDVVPDSRMEMLQVGIDFAADAAVGEMSVVDRDGKPITLVETNSKGTNLPSGIDYPIAVEIPLRANEYRTVLRVRSLEMPPEFLQARFYCNEYPRQIEGQRGFAFKAWEGWPGNGDVRFSNSEPIRYRYDVEIIPDIFVANRAGKIVAAAP